MRNPQFHARKPRKSAPVAAACEPVAPPPVLDDPIMYRPEVEIAVRKSATTNWRAERDGKFPAHHMHGGRAAWFRSQIARHLESLRERATGPGPAPARAIAARQRAAALRRAEV